MNKGGHKNKVEHNPNSNVTYYINEEKRTVVAKIVPKATAFIEQIDSVARKMAHTRNTAISPCLSDAMSYKIYESLLMKRHYTGKAKCSPNDVFDVETGKKLALARAKVKEMEDRVRMFRDVLDWLYAVRNNIEDMFDKEDILLDKYIDESW